MLALYNVRFFALPLSRYFETGKSMAECCFSSISHVRQDYYPGQKMAVLELR
jgi:hypothetical protein